jgi:hypothetical protein
VAHHWEVDIFKVATLQTQEAILRVLRDGSGLTALGATSGSGHFVIVECPDIQTAAAVEQIIEAMDADAVRTYDLALAEPRQPLVPLDGEEGTAGPRGYRKASEVDLEVEPRGFVPE